MFDYEGSRGEFLKILAEFGEEPAFIARGLAPQIALDEFVRSCRTQRDEMLEWPKRHYANLYCRVGGDWIRLARNFASDEEIGKLKILHGELVSDRPISSNIFQTNGSALRQFLQSAHKFNKNWTALLNHVSLDPVNKPRQDYNEFYLVEKGCAFDRVLNENDFVLLKMINRDLLWQTFPLLNLPELA
jgi:hypothetical protein